MKLIYEIVCMGSLTHINLDKNIVEKEILSSAEQLKLF